MVANTSLLAACSSGKREITLVRRAFLDEAALGEVGGAHPDAVAHRHPVDDQQCVQVIDEASRGYVATIDLCGVVDSFTRPDILAADLEKQTRACRSDLPHLGVKLSWV
jgi:hypothetical protein